MLCPFQVSVYLNVTQNKCLQIIKVYLLYTVVFSANSHTIEDVAVVTWRCADRDSEVQRGL